MRFQYRIRQNLLKVDLFDRLSLQLVRDLSQGGQVILTSFAVKLDDLVHF